ncbi:MAG TPA: hypothetical protein VGL07_13310 [Buttiauxella sp.]|jgi:hypothetical protein
MKEEISTFLQQISSELNSDITINENHAWIIPASSPALLLTVTWDRGEKESGYEFTFSLALGEYRETIPSSLLLELLASNIAMSIMQGPKLCYSPGANLLTLTDTLACRPGDEVYIGEAAEKMVSLGWNIHENISTTGTKLIINMDG